MTVEVYKNFLPETLMNQVVGHILEQPHRYGHTSKMSEDIKSPRWYICELEQDIFFSRCMLSFITDKVRKNLSLHKMYANIQYAGQNGGFHVDNFTPHSRTAILMLSKTLPKGSGTFDVKEEGFQNKIETHDFEQNKLLYFKSTLSHRGNAPLEPGFPRVTLAFKMDMYTDGTSVTSRINNIVNK